MYKLDYPNYISALDEGVENLLSYEKCTDEHIQILKKAFKKNNSISLNVSGSTFLNTAFNNSLYVSGRTIL